MIRLTRSPHDALLDEQQAEPRYLIAPAAKYNAWEDVADLSRSFGVELDDWQELILEAAMGERADEKWASKQVGISVPRQNGKSQLLVARALAGALVFGEKKIVISAHAQDTARETFGKFLEQFDQCPALNDRVAKVMNAINRESITFKNGAHVQFKARTVSGARGFSADCLLLDEAQILGMPAWVSINSTMSARKNPQIWLLGTPPTPEDNGEVFESVRGSALTGKGRAVTWVEYSAEPGDDPALEETRAKANPAWHTRINHEVVQGEFETYPPDRFAIDRLGMWRDETAKVERIITAAEWSATAIAAPLTAADAEGGIPSLGIKFSPDGSTVCVVGALRRTGVPVHLELVGAHSGTMRTGTAALVDWVAERAPKYACIAVDGRAHAGAFVTALHAAGVPKRAVVLTTWEQVSTANAMTEQAFRHSEATHLATEGQKMLDTSVESTERRSKDSGAWQWFAPGEFNNAIPVQAMSLALWGAMTSKRKPGRKTRGRVRS